MRIEIRRDREAWAFDVRMGLRSVVVEPVAYYVDGAMRPDFPTPEWLVESVQAEVARRVSVPWERMAET